MIRERLDIELLGPSSPSALDALYDPWRELWLRDRSSTPFQHPAWLTAWWRHLGVGLGALRTLVVRTGRKVAGILPMLRVEEPGGARWMLLGAGTSDYLGGVFEPGREDLLVEAVTDWLARELPPEDRCEWFQLRADSPLARVTRLAGLGVDRGESEACHLARIGGSDRSFEETLPSRFARNLRLAARRASPMTLQRARPDGWSEHFDTLRRLHAAEWNRRGAPGVLEDERVVAAHRECLPRLLEDGVALLLALVRKDAPLALFYGLLDAPRPERAAYFYLGGYDPDQAPLSPGSLVLREAIDVSLHQEGCDRFDFLRGAESYKARWGARPTPTHSVTLRVPARNKRFPVACT